MYTASLVPQAPTADEGFATGAASSAVPDVEALASWKELELH